MPPITDQLPYYLCYFVSVPVDCSGSEEDRSALYRADVAACHPGLIDIDKPVG